MQTTINYAPGDFPGEWKKTVSPYVGVTGFTSTWDVEEAIDNYYKYRNDKPHEFMMGFLLSHEVVEHGSHPNLEKKSRYPDLSKFVNLLEAAEYDDVFRVIHYYTKSNDLHDEISYLLHDLGWESIVDGIQFNVRFPPSKDSIDLIRKQFPSKRLIFQVNSGAYERHMPREIVDMTSKYPIDYVLLDPSGGTGKPIDVKASSKQFFMLAKKMDAMVGFAGGFNPENVADRVRAYKKNIGNQPFCIDAESGLMDLPGGISINKVSRYLKEFFRAV